MAKEMKWSICLLCSFKHTIGNNYRLTISCFRGRNVMTFGGFNSQYVYFIISRVLCRHKTACHPNILTLHTCQIHLNERKEWNTQIYAWYSSGWFINTKTLRYKSPLRHWSSNGISSLFSNILDNKQCIIERPYF